MNNTDNNRKRINLDTIPYIADIKNVFNLPTMQDIADRNKMTEQEVRHDLYFLYANKTVEIMGGNPARVGKR